MVACRFTSAQLPTENELPMSFHVVRTSRICPGSANGSGRKSTVYTTLKIAVVAPMQSASVSTIEAVSAGLFLNERTA